MARAGFARVAMIAVTLGCAAGMALVAVATAATPAASPICLVLNGQEVAAGIPPCVVGGRVFVPLRVVAEAFGCAVAWDHAAQTISVNSPGEHHPVPAPGRGPCPRLVVDGLEARPDPPPLLLGGRLMVPLRLVAEYLGFDVSWDPTSRTVAIGWGGPYLEVHFIGGPAILIELPDGQNILVGAAAEGSGDDGRAVLAYLDAEGITQLNWVVVSGPDADDTGGLGEVIRSVPAGKMLLTEPLAPSVGAAAHARGIEVVDAQPGMTLVRGCDTKGESEISVTVLGPLRPDRAGAGRSSLVLKVSYGEVDFLLAGDAGADEQGDLSTLDLSADVLQVVEGAYPPTPAFLAAVTPRFMVIAGKTGATLTGLPAATGAPGGPPRTIIARVSPHSLTFVPPIH